MRTYHPIVIVTVIGFCLGLVGLGLQETQFSYEGFFRPWTANNRAEAYHARIKAQEATRQAAVERRKRLRAAQRHRRW